MSEYRKPWTEGAHAYPEVDSVKGVEQSMYRKRNGFTAITRQGKPLYERGKCAVCGGPLKGLYTAGGSAVSKPDSYAFVDVSPKARTYVLKHYYCAWQMTMEGIVALRVATR